MMRKAFMFLMISASIHPVIADEVRISVIREIYAAAQQMMKVPEKTETYCQMWDEENARPAKWTASEDTDNAVNSLVLISGGGLSVVKFSTDTPSGDWTISREYYFDASGRLVFIYAEYMTFHGNVRIEYRKYFDEAGSEIKQLKYVFELESGKRKKDDGNYAEPEIIIFPDIASIRSFLKQ